MIITIIINARLTMLIYHQIVATIVLYLVTIKEVLNCDIIFASFDKGF